MTKFEENPKQAYNNLLAAQSDYRKESALFSLDGRNGQLSQRKVTEAIQFLHKYGFVCIQFEENIFFADDVKQLQSAIAQPAPPGHAAYDFVQHKHSGGTSNIFEEQTLLQDIHDFEPNALAHCQAAWNLRCSESLRLFFASLYNTLDGVMSKKWSEICDYANTLVPSIDSIVLPSQQNCLTPTFFYNPTWIRAPHVIAAYHLHAHNEAIATFHKDYIEQQHHANETANNQRWLQRVCKETILTAKKVVLGKRATNKMVQDAAFKQSPDDAKQASMRPLYANYDANIFIGPETASLNVVPGFHNYYVHFLKQKLQKWSQTGADCVSVKIDDDDEYSKTLFQQAMATVQLSPGTVLITNRRMPRWGEIKSAMLPISYRVHNSVEPTIVEQLCSSQLANSKSVLLAAKICPYELALAATYLQSIKNGVTYTSLPHLTGSTSFSRSTRKTAAELTQQRAQIYQKWLSQKRKLVNVCCYQPPVLPVYLSNLLHVEMQLLQTLEKKYQTVDVKHEKSLEQRTEAKRRKTSIPATTKNTITTSTLAVPTVFETEYLHMPSSQFTSSDSSIFIDLDDESVAQYDDDDAAKVDFERFVQSITTV